MKAGDGLLVKDYDGSLKILSDGELKEFGPLLEEARVSTPGAVPMTLPSHAVMVSEAFGKPAGPVDPHFKEQPSSGKGDAIRELHFHPDDHEDVQRELEKIQQFFEAGQQKKYSVQKIAKKLIEKQKLDLDAAQTQAFTSTLLSFFRQMRSTAEVRARLGDSVMRGGLGIAAADADHIVSVAKYLKDKIEEADGTVVEEGAEAMMQVAQVAQTAQPPVASRPPSPVASMSPMPTVATPPPLRVQMPEMAAPQTPAPPPQPVAKPAAAPAPQPRPAQPSPTQEVTASFETPAALPRVQRPSGGIAAVPAFDDVKRPGRSAGFFRGKEQSPLTGRVEELAGMTVELWRLLDENPRIRAGKILGKIQNLERESFTRKSQGISAWRQSPVYQLYLHLGSLSLEQGKEVAQVIAAQAATGAETLTIDEFEAISDLSRMLRF